jgi:hypothetical protein
VLCTRGIQLVDVVGANRFRANSSKRGGKWSRNKELLAFSGN